MAQRLGIAVALWALAGMRLKVEVADQPRGQRHPHQSATTPLLAGSSRGGADCAHREPLDLACGITSSPAPRVPLYPRRDGHDASELGRRLARLR